MEHLCTSSVFGAACFSRGTETTSEFPQTKLPHETRNHTHTHAHARTLSPPSLSLSERERVRGGGCFALHWGQYIHENQSTLYNTINRKYNRWTDWRLVKTYVHDWSASVRDGVLKFLNKRLHRAICYQYLQNNCRYWCTTMCKYAYVSGLQRVRLATASCPCIADV